MNTSPVTTQYQFEKVSKYFYVGKDLKGFYTTHDFPYIKECSKTELGIELIKLDSSLQADDSIKTYFKITEA